MADVAATVDVFNRLKVGELSADWVKSTCEHDFTEVEPLSLDLEEELQAQKYHVATLQALHTHLQTWVSGGESDTGQGFWTVLVENDISLKSLSVLLFYLMEVGQKRTASACQKEAGIRAASTYFHLVAIPGSRAFKIFHPILFQKAVDSFKGWAQLGGAPTKKRKASRSPERSSQRRGKKKSRVEVEEDMWDDEDEEEVGVLSARDLSNIHSALITLLRDFVVFLDVYTLSDSGDSAHHALAILGELIKQNPETFEAGFQSSMPVRIMASVPQLAYKAMGFLCAKHGDVTTMVTACFKYLLPGLLMLVGDNKGVCASGIPRHLQTIKDQGVAFIEHLLSIHGDKVLPSIRILLQHMCTKVPDKSDYRAKVAEAVVRILSKLRVSAFSQLMEWIYKYSRNAKIGYRVFALDLVCLLLEEPERQPTEGLAPEKTVFLSHRFLLQMMLSRCSDNASTVRARAILGFAQCSSSTEPTIKDAIKEMVTPQPPNMRGPVSRVVPTPEGQRTTPLTEPQNESHEKSATTPENNTLEAASTLEKTDANEGSAHPTPSTTNPPIGSINLTPGAEITLSDGKGMASMLRRRASDEKVNVRKAALQALENVIRLDGMSSNKEDLAVLHDRCQDPALSVRKQALQCLTDLLLDFPAKNDFHMVWLDAVLPMVIDRETSAQEKCLEILDSVILGNIAPHQRSNDELHKLTWNLLEVMAGNHGSDLRRFFQKACQHWGRAGKMRPSLIGYLQTHIETENNVGVWMLLAEATPFMKKMSSGFVLDYWRNHASSAPDEEFQTVQRVLVVLSHLAGSFSQEERQLLSDDLKGRLMRFDSTPEVIATVVDCLNKLCLAETGDVTATQAKTQDWFAELLKACDSYLSQVILAENEETPLDEDRVVRYLFTLGEIAQLCPSRTPRRVFMLVQSLIAAPTITTVDGSTQIPRDQTDEATHTPDITPQDGTSQQNATPSNNSPVDSTASSQNSQGSSQFSRPGSSQWTQYSQEAFSQFRGSRMSNKVRAHAFVTLGKLCLQNEDIAKKCIAALARELEISHDPAIRNNVVIIMCDLCVRYTSVVDRYVPNVAACLKDESALVRKQTLILLTHLLQEDFLKWKGSLFFRFITTLVDDDKDIKAFAEFCLVHQLMQRHPSMFHHHFLECIFHFNSYDGHKMYNKFSQTDREKKMFSLKGQVHAKKRMRIYRTMLEHMTDEHRFQLTAKMCQEVLGGVVDGIIPLDSETSALLQDTLAILVCKEVKLASMRSRPADDIVEEQDMAQAVMQAAKKTIITQVVRKNVIENIVPIVISLKHMLEKHHSPVLRDLMMYLRELMKDYKTEVKDIMSADKQLATEIEFDMRKFDEQQAAAEQAKLLQQTVSPLVGQPGSAATPPRRAGRNSPRPSPFITPRLGNAVSPHTPGGPAAGPSPRPLPILALNGQKLNTPAKSMSLSTMAIMNSARKAIANARRVSLTNSNTPSQKKKVGWADEQDGNLTSPEQTDSETFKTPQAKQKRIGTPDRRAISTPAVNMSLLGNLTFQQGEQNMSMLPPSPIPSSLPLRLYGRSSSESEGTPSWTAQTEEERQAPAKDVVHMFSPDHPAPKPRKWNIRSKAPVLQLEESDNDEVVSKDDAEDRLRPLVDNRQSNSGTRKTARATRRSKEVDNSGSADANTENATRRSSRNSSGDTGAKTSGRKTRGSISSTEENKSDLNNSKTRKSNTQKKSGRVKKSLGVSLVDSDDDGNEDTMVTFTPRRSARKSKK